MGFQGVSRGKEPSCQWRRYKRCWFSPWIGKIPWRRKWQPTPVFLSGESHGWRSLEAHRLSKRWTWLKLLSMHVHRGEIPWSRTCRTQDWERSLGWPIKSRGEAGISLWRAGLDRGSEPDSLPCCLWSYMQMRAPNSLTPLTQENLRPTPWQGERGRGSCVYLPGWVGRIINPPASWEWPMLVVNMDAYVLIMNQTKSSKCEASGEGINQTNLTTPGKNSCRILQ